MLIIRKNYYNFALKIVKYLPPLDMDIEIVPEQRRKGRRTGVERRKRRTS